jgi:hypothetical protein
MTVTTNVDGMLSHSIVVLKKHGVRNSRGKTNSRRAPSRIPRMRIGWLVITFRKEKHVPNLNIIYNEARRLIYLRPA